jgi:hypothetical protein
MYIYIHIYICMYVYIYKQITHRCAEPGVAEDEIVDTEKQLKLSCHIEGSVPTGDGGNKGGTDMMTQGLSKVYMYICVCVCVGTDMMTQGLSKVYILYMYVCLCRNGYDDSRLVQGIYIVYVCVFV